MEAKRLVGLVTRRALIAFEGERAALTTSPSGLRHKLSTSAFGAIGWSPDGTQLAFLAPAGIAVARANGQALKRLKLGLDNAWA